MLGTAVKLPNITITDVELDNGLDSYADTTLTVARSDSGQGFAKNAEDIFGFSADSGLVIEGSSITHGGKTIATFTNAGGELKITFTADATTALVNQVASAITYANSSQNPDSSVTLRYRFDDANDSNKQGTGGALTGDASVVVNITAQNDPPVANPKTNNVYEDGVGGSGIASGNIKVDGGTPDSDPDNAASELKVTTVVNSDNTSFPIADTGDTVVQGKYGTLKIGADGSYTYTLDSSNLTVQGLNQDESLNEVFHYTIADPQGKSDTSTLTITIEGQDDGVTVTLPPAATDTATQADQNTQDLVVFEQGLSNGSQPNTADVVVDSTITLKALDGLDTDEAVTIIYTDRDGNPANLVLSKAEVEALGTTPQTVQTQYGELLINGYTQAADGSITLDYTYTLQQAPSTPGADARDPFTVVALDRDGDTESATVSIKIVDDVPEATADTATITEDAIAPVEGNVITGTGTNLGGKDTVGADGAVVTGVAAGGQSGPVTGSVGGEGVKGSYGTVVINADGSYSYTLDNSNLAVQGLAAGETLTETYTYTITDADGDTATSTLTITIEGQGDGVTVTLPPAATDTATQADQNTQDLVVFEQGLSNGSQPNTADVVVDSTITLKALDGLDTDEAVTIIYTDRDGNPANLVLSKAEVEALGTTPQTVQTQYGELLINGYTQAADGSITLDYTYTLQQAPSTPGADARDPFTVVALDRDGDTESATVSIKIVDDVPKATADTATITEDAIAPVEGNVITGTGTNLDGKDTVGADGAFVTGVAAGGQSGPVTGSVGGEGVKGSYGTVVINADGSYSYTLDNSNLAVQALAAGETLTETYTYTITDADGDTATTTLTITIEGQGDGVTVTLPPAATDTATQADQNTQDLVVFEQGLSNGSQPNTADVVVDSTITLKALDGLDTDEAVTIIYTDRDGNPANLVLSKAEVEALGTTPQTVQTQYGELLINGYTQAADGSITLDYTYTLQQAPSTPGADARDPFTVVALDRDGDTESATVSIKIVDDVPKATADTANVSNQPNAQGKTTASGNALDNDTPGADGGVTVTSAKGPQDTTPVVADPDTGLITVTGEHGTLVIDADGNYTYTRNDNSPLEATEVFEYTITDKDGDPSSATITINIADKAPSFVPAPDAGSEPPRGSVSESGLPGGSQSDSGSHKTEGTLHVDEGDQNTRVSITPPGATTATEVPAGVPTTITTDYGKVTVTFTPGDGAGKQPTIHYEYELTQPTDGSAAVPPTDSFVVTITDADGDSASTTVTVDISDDAPVARDDSNHTLVNVPVTGQLGGNDSPGADGIDSWTLAEPPLHGKVTIDPATGEYQYTPEPGFVGSDSFRYTITDKDGSSHTATVTIEVTNQPPVARDDTHVTGPGEPAVGNVITGGSAGDQADSDPDGQPISVVEVTVDGITLTIPANDSVKILLPNKGLLEIGSDGSYRFTPNPMWGGQVPDIHYTLSDGFGGTDTAVLRITATAAPLNVDIPARPDAGIPTDIGSTIAPPLTGGSQSHLILRDAMVNTPSVFWEIYDYFHRVLLPVPLHPITYVNAEVQRSQLQAVQSMLDNWPALKEERLRSRALDLGQDPTLFVQYAVQASQQERRYLDFLARELKANLPVQTPVQTMLTELPSEQSPQTQAPSLAPADMEPQTPQQPAAEASEKPQAVLDLLQRWQTAEVQESAGPATGMMSALMAGKASSFSEQLRESASQLPGNVS